VTRQGRKVATLGPGSAFGELALLDRAPRNASVVAETPMELVVLGQREFAGILDEVPGFARKLLAGLAHRLRDADAKSVQ
jgi:CRP-like cAMP-binding protein